MLGATGSATDVGTWTHNRGRTAAMVQVVSATNRAAVLLASVVVTQPGERHCADQHHGWRAERAGHCDLEAPGPGLGRPRGGQRGCAQLSTCSPTAPAAAEGGAGKALGNRGPFFWLKVAKAYDL